MLFPLINGHYYSFQDIELVIAPLLRPALPFAGVRAINYDDNLTKAKVRGTARVPLGVTAGRYEAKGDIELYKPAADILITTLGPGWRDVTINFTVSYAVAEAPGASFSLPVTTDIFSGQLTELSAAQSEGEEPLVRKFGITIPGQIFWNGIPSIVDAGLLASIG